jgi:hypothetical protein
MPQEVCDFFKRRVRGKIGDVVAAIGEAAFFAGDATERSLADDDSLKTGIDGDCRVLNDALDLSGAAFAER